MLFNRHLIVAAGLLLLSACVTTSKSPIMQSGTSRIEHEQHLVKLAQIQSFGLKGRLGVVTQKQGFSGGIDWQHTVDTDNVDVYSPVGGKVANISKKATEVTLTKQDGHNLTAKDTESLTETALGFKLPLLGLSDWALGRPTAGSIISSTWNESGQLLTLKQDGWDISYENYGDNAGLFLPNKIVLKSEKVNLKLIVEEWISVSKQ